MLKKYFNHEYLQSKQYSLAKSGCNLNNIHFSDLKVLVKSSYELKQYLNS